jgi:hypothetical protein
MGLATFWATFSSTRLVTLLRTGDRGTLVVTSKCAEGSKERKQDGVVVAGLPDDIILYQNSNMVIFLKGP